MNEDEVELEWKEEVVAFLTDVQKTFVEEVRGDDYDKWPDEYNCYVYERLKEIKPRIFEALDKSPLDATREVFKYYLHSVWDFDWDSYYENEIGEDDETNNS